MRVGHPKRLADKEFRLDQESIVTKFIIESPKIGKK
jgi:hypothetical protein